MFAGFLSSETMARELHVWSLQVRSDYQKRGIGRSLLEAAIDYARDCGLTRLTLTTFRDLAFNEGFYASMGFQRLEGSDVPERLAKELQNEAEQGLPIERRCAMVLKLG